MLRRKIMIMEARIEGLESIFPDRRASKEQPAEEIDIRYRPSEDDPTGVKGYVELLLERVEALEKACAIDRSDHRQIDARLEYITARLERLLK
jgi:hypothetical protein